MEENDSAGESRVVVSRFLSGRMQVSLYYYIREERVAYLTRFLEMKVVVH